MKKQCPKCHPQNVHLTSNGELHFITCCSCGYDESLHDVIIGTKTNSKEKSRYNPYKQGGKRRTQKR